MSSSAADHAELKRAELKRLVTRLIERNIEPAGLAELEEALSTDAELRAYYLEYTELHSLLHHGNVSPRELNLPVGHAVCDERPDEGARDSAREACPTPRKSLLQWASRNPKVGHAVCDERPDEGARDPAREACPTPRKSLLQWASRNPKVGHAVCDERPDEGARDPAREACPTPRKSLLQWASRNPKGPAVTIAATVLIAALVVMGLTPVKQWIAEQDKAGQEEKGAKGASDFVAKLSNWHNDVWLEDTRPPLDDPRLNVGKRLKIESGLIEITYLTGARVVIEGPAEFVVGGTKAQREEENGAEDNSRGRKPADLANSGYLKLGKLVARVEGKKAQGFAINTPTARVEDQGTEFGIEVRRDGEAFVQVIDGKVDLVVRTGAGSERKRIVAGRSVAVDQRRRIRVVQQRDLAFVRALPAISSTVLTFEMTDPSPKNNANLLPDYGNRVGAVQEVGERHTYRYGGIGFTPNIAVAYEASEGAKFLLWPSKDWRGGVAYLRLEPPDAVASIQPHYDTVFTADEGFGVRVRSFVVDDWDGDGEGHVVNWRVYAGTVAAENIVASGDNVEVASDEELKVSVDNTAFHKGVLILRIQHIAGKGNYMAIDNIHFEQTNWPSEGALLNAKGVLRDGEKQ